MPKPNLDEIVKSHLDKIRDAKAERVIFRVTITCIYVVLLLVIGYKQVPLKSFHAAQTVRNAFVKNLSFVTNLNKLNIWAEKKFSPAMFDTHKYNRDELHWKD